jgi:hypothetical protein
MATELSDLMKESREDCLCCRAGRPKTLCRANEPRRKAEETKYMMGCIKDAVELSESAETVSSIVYRSIAEVL